MNNKLLISALALALGLSACNKAPEETQASTTDTTQTTAAPVAEAVAEPASTLPDNAPTYTVGTIGSFPPFVESDEFGKPAGFDMDILKAIGEHEGFKVEFLVSPWQGLLEQLEEDKRDIVATGVVITDERKLSYDFSNPYLDTKWAGFLLAKDDGTKYNSFSDLLNGDTTFVTQKGSAGVDALNDLLKDKAGSAKILEVDSQFEELEAVVRGEADVAYDISRVLQYYANTDDMKSINLYMLEDSNSETQNFGYVVKKDRNDDLLAKINSGLEKIKADGTYDKIYAKWFE